MSSNQDFNKLADLILEVCVRKNPDATKWDEIKDLIIQANPAVANIDPKITGSAFGLAKRKLKAELKKKDQAPRSPPQGGSSTQGQENNTEAKPENKGGQEAFSGLTGKVMEGQKLAKAVEKVVNSMLKKNVNYFGLLAATLEVGKPDYEALLEKVTGIILELQKKFFQLNSSK